MRLLPALALMLSASPALADYDAGPFDIRSEYSANRTINTATAASKSWSATNDGSALKLGRNFTMAAPGGRTVTMAAKASLSKGLALTWAARALAIATPIGTALSIYGIYDAVRVRERSDGEGLLWDPGQPAGTVETRCYTSSRVASCKSSESVFLSTHGATACGVYGVSYTSSTVFSRTTAPNGLSGSLSFHVLCTGTNPNGSTYTTTIWSESGSWTGGTAMGCPLGGSPGFDGRCPTGQFGEPITPEEASAKRALAEAGGTPVAPLTDAQYQQMVNEALGITTFPFSSQSFAEFDGNVVGMEVAGPTTTTTGPAGTTTTAIAWRFTPYGITKGWQERLSGFWDTKTTTTKRDPNGNIVEIGTVTTGGQTEEEAAKGVDCTKTPDILGCQLMGTPPTDQVPKRTLTVSYAEESIGLPSGCPADIVLPGGKGTLSYGQTCAGLDKLRPLIIALGAFAAATMVVFTLRS